MMKHRLGFTLLELLVVMGLLILLAVLTGIGVNRMSGQAKLSSGVNTVLAALGTARAHSIQNNVTTMVTFRVRVDPAQLSEGEIIDVVFAEASGELTPWLTHYRAFHERYVPIAGLPPLQMPEGIKVAGPLTADYENPNQLDDVWVTQPGGKWRLWGGRPVSDETGRMIAVLFSSDGSMVMRDPASAGGAGATAWPYLDLDLNRRFEPVNHNGYSGVFQYVAYDAVGDEGDVLPCQWLAVYDDEEARTALGAEDWTGEAGDAVRMTEITGWVNGYGVPIHFNRYTGVAEVRRP
jgi:type II secretory pathway pseudopilin PulG